jgi:hypothetical protein
MEPLASERHRWANPRIFGQKTNQPVRHGRSRGAVSAGTREGKRPRCLSVVGAYQSVNCGGHNIATKISSRCLLLFLGIHVPLPLLGKTYLAVRR